MSTWSNFGQVPVDWQSYVGQVFGRWTVLSVGKKEHGLATFLCRCACGVERELNAQVIRKGKSGSCGCLSRELSYTRNRRHGHAAGRKTTPEFESWSGMKKRCYKETNRDYPDYGGRGIIVCERWLHSFDAFLEDMGLKPSRRHSLDRVDSNGNYEPGNCKWSTPKEQSRNKRCNIYLTVFGETKLMVEWCEQFGIQYKLAHERIFRNKWGHERALTAPVINHRSKKAA